MINFLSLIPGIIVPIVAIILIYGDRKKQHEVLNERNIHKVKSGNIPK